MLHVFEHTYVWKVLVDIRQQNSNIVTYSVNTLLTVRPVIYVLYTVYIQGANFNEVYF